MKKQLINRLTKINATTAFGLECNSLAINKLPNDIWLSDYIKDYSKYIGDTGGPSRAEIWDYKHKWNHKKLASATVETLQKLVEFAEEEYRIRTAIYDKYGKGNFIDVIRTMANDFKD